MYVQKTITFLVAVFCQSPKLINCLENVGRQRNFVMKSLLLDLKVCAAYELTNKGELAECLLPHFL